MKLLNYLSVFFFLWASTLNVQAQLTVDWQKCIGGSENDYPWDMKATLDGGWIIAGSAASDDGDLTKNNGNEDAWLVKIDDKGAISWQQNYGGSNDDLFRDVIEVSDGYIALGNTWSNDGDVNKNRGKSDAWIVKVSKTGVIKWSTTFGGSLADNFYSIVQNGTSYLAIGDTESSDGDIQSNHGNVDYLLVEFDDKGSSNWQKTYGGSFNEWGKIIKPLSSGFVIGGQAFSMNGDVVGNNGGGDYWIIKIDNKGVKQWAKCYGGSNDDWLNSIEVSMNDDIFVTGGATSGNGDVKGNKGKADVWTLKINSSGTIIWSANHGGSDDDWGMFIDATDDMGLIIGSTTSSEDGDVSNANSGQDIWVTKLTSSGSIEWEATVGGSSDEWPRHIEQKLNGTIVVLASVSSSDGDIKNNHGKTDFWLAELSQKSTGISKSKYGAMQVYPNPTHDVINIEYTPGISESYKIEVLDVFGQKITEKAGSRTGNTRLDMKGFAPGNYFIIVSENNLLKCRKLIQLR